MMTSFHKLIPLLANARVKFILIGGVAAAVHGAARATYDVDVVYDRSPENIRRLVGALSKLNPYPRGAPPGLPFIWDELTLKRGLNFTLTTKFGSLDLLGEVAGGGNYRELLAHSVETEGYGVTFSCVDLATLIKLKRAAGRPKDYEALAELEALFDANRGTNQ